MRNAYLRRANIDVSVKRLHYFCINKNKMVISREDRMLIKVLHQKKGYCSKKLLVEFPNTAFELIPTCSMCWKLAFSVLVLKDKKNITTQETQFIEILHTVPKCVLDNAV